MVNMTDIRITELDSRPDYIPDDPEDHPYVTALELLLATKYSENFDSFNSIAENNVLPIDVFRIGYSQAIYDLRNEANGSTFHTELIIFEEKE